MRVFQDFTSDQPIEYVTFFGDSPISTTFHGKICKGCRCRFHTQVVAQEHCSDLCRWGGVREVRLNELAPDEVARALLRGIGIEFSPYRFSGHEYVGHSRAPKPYEPSKYKRSGKTSAVKIRQKSKKGKGGGE